MLSKVSLTSRSIVTQELRQCSSSGDEPQQEGTCIKALRQIKVDTAGGQAFEHYLPSLLKPVELGWLRDVWLLCIQGYTNEGGLPEFSKVGLNCSSWEAAKGNQDQAH